MAKKKMDKLAWENAQALACHMSYGKWKAMQYKPVPKTEEPKKEQKKDQPERWKICPWCKKEFKAKTNQIYCEPYCQCEAAKQMARDRKEAAKNK